MDWREWLTLFIGTVLWLTFFVLIAASLIVWFRSRSEFHSAMPDHEEALAILERRREAGEITQGEYERIRRDLMS